MKGNTITIYELMGLIKDGKAPKEIKINNKVFEWTGKNYIGGNCFLLSFISIENEIDIPNLKVEILSKENDEWEDIEELRKLHTTDYSYDTAVENRKAINQLIKNQKYLKEKLDRNEIMFDYYVEKLEAKEKLESKDENVKNSS